MQRSVNQNLISTKLALETQPAHIPIIYRRGALLDLKIPKERSSTNFCVACILHSELGSASCKLAHDPLALI